ncbi:tyrosine-type recombinase/integrase [Saccharopolyspora sp. WRP15-2]|uniref:Tyrosine-type recombinase/integrase n=1 Tax=Saccharopolyspora oryzae TaxID=2997343 RepID=A0ABT4URH8_9PSEU|nr:tyrosine-type recombinase/integrase [Saccharopolyspora oryzae]MDA3624297.1 tyrosine-type recombinase/integrase [Saccharopolyspora oryzae]
MASTEKLPSGNWRGLYYDAEGRKRRVQGTFPRKKDALDAAQEAEVRARRRATLATDGALSASLKWGDWCDIWWPTRQLEDSTKESERKVFNKHLYQPWGDVPLNRISRRMIQDWVNELRQTVQTQGFLLRVYSLFRTSIIAAVDRGILEANPCVSIKIPRPPKTRRLHLEADRFSTLLQAMHTERYREAVEFLWDTGLRPGELAGLHRDHVEDGWLVVAQVWTGKAIKSYPKDDDVREIPLTARAQELLVKWERETPTGSGCCLPHLAGKACRSDLAFRQPNGNVLDLNNFYHVVHRGAVRAKLPSGVSPYTFRHSYGTRLADAGVDAFELSRLLGHSKLEQSLTYVHRSEAARSRVLAALGDEEMGKLHIVGRDLPRGTQRGTQRRTSVSDHDQSESRKKEV